MAADLPFPAVPVLLYEPPGKVMPPWAFSSRTAAARFHASPSALSIRQYSYSRSFHASALDPISAPYRRRQQAQPQAINRNAVTNSNSPTGNIAAIRMPVPNAAAQIPKKKIPLFPHIRHASSPRRNRRLFQHIRRGLSGFRKNSTGAVERKTPPPVPLPFQGRGNEIRYGFDFAQLANDCYTYAFMPKRIDFLLTNALRCGNNMP